MHVIDMCVHHWHLCMCLPVSRANSLYIHVCVSVALQQWRHQDTWHHTDMTQHSTPQDASDSLTWKMRYRREHQQADRKPNPVSACCFTETVSVTQFLLWINSQAEIETQHRQVGYLCTQIHFYSQWGVHCKCVCASVNWPLWTPTNFIQRREKQLKTTPGTCVTNYKKKHICVHFPLGGCPILRYFDASALTGCFSVFLLFLFSQRNICWQGGIRAWIHFNRLGILARSH